MAPRSAIVSGGSGFIGSHLCEALVAADWVVVALDDHTRGDPEHVLPLEASGRFGLIDGDAADDEAWEAALDLLQELVEEVADGESSGLTIFHLAAVNGTRWFHEAPDRVAEVNIGALLVALDIAQAEGARFVFTSSPEAFGATAAHPLPSMGGTVTFEPAESHGRWSYGASKYLGEVLVQHAVRQGLDGRIVRPFNGYGPRNVSDEYGQVVAMFLRQAMKGGPLAVHGDGQQSRAFTWVGDLARALVLAGALDEATDGSGELAGRAWNVGWPEATSIAALAELVARLVGETTGTTIEIETGGEGQPGDSARRAPDNAPALADLGWAPEVDLEDGLRRTLDSVLG